MPPLGKETLKAMRSGDTEASVAFVKVRRERKGRWGKVKASEQLIFLPLFAMRRESALRHEAERLRPDYTSSGTYVDAGYITASPDGVTVSADFRAVLDVPALPTNNDHEAERNNTVRSVQKIAGRRILVSGKLPPKLP